MSKCPDCGTQISPDHAFCLACGRELEEEPAIVPPAARHLMAEAGGEVESGDGGFPRTGAGAWSGAASVDPGPGSSPAAAAGDRPAAQGPAPKPPQGPRAGALHPAAVALVVSALFQAAVSTFVSPDAYVTRLFRPSGGMLMGVVPALIGFAFVWTLTDLALKLRNARVNEHDFRRPEIRHLPSYVAQGAWDIALQRLHGWDAAARARPVGRQILWILQHLQTTDPARAHEFVRHQSDLEADSTASGYRTVKLFIWAMPILGFIGTVLGISLAVGGFSEFLTTNVSIDQIDAVTAELGEVAAGLSFAFDTTLLGLLGGLVASVFSSAVQAREERLLTRVEELGLRILEIGPPVPAAPIGKPGSEAGAELERIMKDRLGELSLQMDRFSDAVRASLDAFVGEWAKLPVEVEGVGSELGTLRQHLASAAIGSQDAANKARLVLDDLSAATAAARERINASVSSIGDTARGLGEALEQMSERLTTSMSGVTERLAESDERLGAAVGALSEAVDRNRAEMAEALGVRLESLTQKLSGSASSLTGRLAESDERLRTALEALVESDERLRSVVEGIAVSASESDGRLREVLEGLSESVERSREEGVGAAEARAATQAALAELSKSIGELNTSLETLREVQAGLVPIVSKLAGPLELRLVPPD